MIVRFSLLLSFYLIAASMRADVTALRVVQSGDALGSMAMHDRGVQGRGEIIAIVDEGADLLSCAFAEENGSLPPFNTVTTAGDLASAAVDLARRKIVAYDLLFSCDQYPDYRFECDEPGDPWIWSSSRGTEIASIAAGDSSPFWIAGEGDGLAPAAKLVIQDTGYIPNRLPGPQCTLAGLCRRLSDLTPVLAQAYLQGARIQSHQWTDRVWPDDRAELTRQLDAFVASHPDFVLVFEAGDAGETGSGSVARPGTAKNVIQAGGTREMNFDDSVVWEKSGRGAGPYGRIKPDLVIPSFVFSSSHAGAAGVSSCEGAYVAGTALSAPLVAGAAALVRQYYREGFYPTGSARARDALEPSAALVKATLIAAARPVPYLVRNGVRIEAGPAPSYDQGFGMPVLADVLSFDARAPRMRAVDGTPGLAAGETYEVSVR
ncbi:MAG TPA: S8 family serine peptidase, partial [Thermoanaerobaculia bacterium]